MSPSPNVLSVQTPDKVSEIAVLDGRQNRVATGLGALRAELPAGLYKVRVRVGSATSEQLVSLDQDRVISFKTEELKFPTPVPLMGTSRSHEYHMQAALDASDSKPVKLGEGATLLIFSRDWTPGETAAGAPMAGLTLHDAAGSQMLKLEDVADVRRQGDVSAGSLISVVPGAYRLRLTLPDKTASERIIIGVPQWQTQIFMLMRDYGEERRADLAGGAILMSKGAFDPSGKAERVAVLARYALTQDRKIADAVYQELLQLKFQDPILGLLAAHLLLRDEPEKRDIRKEVLTNVRAMLGAEHPDVRALELGDPGAAEKSKEHSFRWPPMLRASWDLITAASVALTVKVPKRSIAASIMSLVLPTAPWLTWQAGEQRAAILKRAQQQKMAALAEFVHGHGIAAGLGRGISGTAGAPVAESLEVGAAEDPTATLPGMASILSKSFGAPSEGTEPRATGTTARVDLGADVKTELTRSLGVTGSALNAMLAKL
ncbi:hypothetical protein SAMN05519103_05068 [Rhizobiales bacterium GAS113]|nr:hypothetical protein SAMN05519103_05068 [Rhizobiales bacterium GAS113]